MSYTIKHFNEEERKAFVEEHRLAEPKEWALMDGELVMGFFDSKEGAEEFLAELVKEGKVTDSFDNWVVEAAKTFDLFEVDIRELIQGHLK